MEGKIRPARRDLTRCVLFDWGNTLMRELPGSRGPMADWPRVEALPHAREALERLHPGWLLALATNAADSDEAEIARALGRAGLGDLIDRIFCQRGLGVRKPSLEFFEGVLQGLGVPPERVVMVGDDFTNDVEGAVRAGLRAIWLREGQDGREEEGENHRVIHDLEELPAVLEAFGPR